ncbi:hypothetical protein T265_15449, partial [Opisthorchis viverrini]
AVRFDWYTVHNQNGQEASSLTCAQLFRHVEQLGCLLQDKAKATVGPIVALLYPPSTEMNRAFYGVVPIPMDLPRLDQSGFDNTSSTPSSSGLVAHLSGTVGSGSSTGLRSSRKQATKETARSRVWPVIGARSHSPAFCQSREHQEWVNRGDINAVQICMHECAWEPCLAVHATSPSAETVKPALAKCQPPKDIVLLLLLLTLSHATDDDGLGNGLVYLVKNPFHIHAQAVK